MPSTDNQLAVPSIIVDMLGPLKNVLNIEYGGGFAQGVLDLDQILCPEYGGFLIMEVLIMLL